MNQDDETWTLANDVGRLCDGALQARALQAEIDLTQPQLGLRTSRLAGQPHAGQHLQLAPTDNHAVWPANLTDAYVRGRDLVAAYSGTDAWPYSPTVYWTADPCDPQGEIRASLSLVISIQTNLLDTHPQIDIRSALAVDEIVMVTLVEDDLLVDSHGAGIQAIDPRASACGLIWRLPGESLSYAELMPTADFREFAIDRAAGTIGSRWQLFGEFLEKGVIRRARLQSLLLPRENDVQLTAEACQSIERRPLPLTT